MQAAEIGSHWDRVFGKLDKQTTMLILNLLILGIVVWLMYTLAMSYEAVLTAAAAGKGQKDEN